jgi:aminoglycoside 3'-phosphotransferase-2
MRQGVRHRNSQGVDVDFEVLNALPACWRARIAERKIVPVTSGMSGAFVFRMTDRQGGDQYLKMAVGALAESLRSEVERTEWLASMAIQVPRIIMRLDDKAVFAVTMSALSGESAEHMRPSNCTPLVIGIARALSNLHSLPLMSCPFDESLRVRLGRARDQVQQGTVDATEFDPRNVGVEPEQLYDRLKRNTPVYEDLVVVHGDATLSNLILGDNWEVGFVDCGNAGRADRYVDLALVVGEIEERFGPDARDIFSDAYGKLNWDSRKAAFYRDLYEFF